MIPRATQEVGCCLMCDVIRDAPARSACFVVFDPCILSPVSVLVRYYRMFVLFFFLRILVVWSVLLFSLCFGSLFSSFCIVVSVSLLAGLVCVYSDYFSSCFPFLCWSEWFASTHILSLSSPAGYLSGRHRLRSRGGNGHCGRHSRQASAG